MLPTYTALFEEHRWLCISRSAHYTEREIHDAQIAIARARLLAAKLAGGRTEDEPAALLLALLLEPEALGEVRNTFPVVAVAHFLRASQHLELSVDLTSRIELRAVRARALPHQQAPEQLRGFVGELRAFLGTRLRPLP